MGLLTVSVALESCTMSMQSKNSRITTAAVTIITAALPSHPVPSSLAHRGPKVVKLFCTAAFPAKAVGDVGRADPCLKPTAGLP